MQLELHESRAYIQLNSTLAIDLEAGFVIHNDHEEELTAQEHKLCILLAHKMCTAPRSYLPTHILIDSEAEDLERRNLLDW